MFTGLIQDIGKIKVKNSNDSGVELEIETGLASEISIDDSIACNGVCLTATAVSKSSFTTQAIHMTLEKTSLGSLETGSHLNLELALKFGDRLGGHLVQGHVQQQTRLLESVQKGDNWELTFERPESLKTYILAESSIAIDGISLTVAKVWEDKFLISIIPHTYTHTNIQYLKIGDAVNVEIDMMAKYVEAQVQAQIKQHLHTAMAKD